MEEWLTRRPVTAEIAGSNPVILVMLVMNFVGCIPTFMVPLVDGLEFVELFPIDQKDIYVVGDVTYYTPKRECSSIGLEHRLVTPKVAGSSPVFLVAK